jgi:hypothetical protein
LKTGWKSSHAECRGGIICGENRGKKISGRRKRAKAKPGKETTPVWKTS